MNLQQLFQKQLQLDTYIEQTKNIEQPMFQEKGLALIVELNELANETRCFKFWSEKGPSEKDVLLEEYVDSVHFLLSLGLVQGFNQQIEWNLTPIDLPLTALFLHIQRDLVAFIYTPTEERYIRLWDDYGHLAKALHFSLDEIVEAYDQKHETNYVRQQQNY